VLGRVPTGAALPDGTLSQTVKRACLHSALHEEAARRGVEMDFGKRLIGAEAGRGGQVVARFQDGTRATGDLLIGAGESGPTANRHRSSDPRSARSSLSAPGSGRARLATRRAQAAISESGSHSGSPPRSKPTAACTTPAAR
jgi:hypothetical protein